MTRRKRGDCKEGLLFWRYKKGKEQWVTKEKYQILSGQKVAWTRANIDRVRAVNKKSAALHADTRRARAKERGYTPEQAAKRRALAKLRYQKDKDVGKARINNWRRDNPERSREITKAYRTRYPDRFRDSMNRWAKKMRATDVIYSAATRLRRRLKVAVDGKCLSKRDAVSKSRDRVTIAFLQWLAGRQSLGEVYWTRYAIDHIIPVVWWKDNRPDELELMNAPENVRWLTPSENSKKSASMPSQEEIDAHLLLVSEWRSSLASKPQ